MKMGNFTQEGGVAVSRYADDFLQDLKINVNELAESHSQALFLKCEDVAEPLSELLGEVGLSVLARLAQEAYYQALDTMVEALRVTILDDDAR